MRSVSSHPNPRRTLWLSAPLFLVSSWLLFGAGKVYSEPVSSYVGLEAWSNGGINSSLQDEIDDASRELGIIGIEASGSVSSTEGLGLRVGFTAPVRRNLELGASLGYVRGPKITEKFNLGPLVYVPTGDVYSEGHAETKTTLQFARVLADAAVKTDLGRSAQLRLGVGAGFAVGRLDQDRRNTGSAALLFPSNSFDDNWTGFTWEFGASFLMPFKPTELELGVRFAQFPTRKSDDNLSELDWQPLGIFASLRFKSPEAPPSRQVYEVGPDTTYENLVDYFLNKDVESAQAPATKDAK